MTSVCFVNRCARKSSCLPLCVSICLELCPIREKRVGVDRIILLDLTIKVGSYAVRFSTCSVLSTPPLGTHSLSSTCTTPQCRILKRPVPKEHLFSSLEVDAQREQKG